MNKLKIKPVEHEKEIEIVRGLFLEYAASLGFSLCFQGFDEELKTLPGKYSPPDGQILLAHYENKPAGCVAMRKIEPGICEMKRLFVKPDYRGFKIGKKLAEEIILAGKYAGYQCMRLDTLSSMISAITLYKSLGFSEIEPYYFNPIEDAVYMELYLTNYNVLTSNKK